MQKLFKQFSFPGGIPSHVAPETPGSIHEGGELGYSLAHAFGAVLDNPDLIAACVVGDGEAETGPLATAWHGNKFLNPIGGRRRPAHPAPERLQDRITRPSSPASPTNELTELLPRLRLGRRASSRATSPMKMHQADGRRPGLGHP